MGRVDSQAEREKLHAEEPDGVPQHSWYTGDNIEMAFGQGGTALTPIEQAVAYATFANGGTRYAPQVASEIVNPTTGRVVKAIAPEVTGHVNLPAAVPSPILQGLEEVISNHARNRLLGLPGFPRHLEPGRQDRDGDQPRSQTSPTAGSWPSGPTPTRSTWCWPSSTRAGTGPRRPRRWCATSSTTS